MALEYFGRLTTLTVNSKGLQDVVTEADVAVENLIKGRLAESYPSDAFLGEETGHADFPGSTGIWVVDPIDGTQPFVSGLPTWCMSIAYVQNGAVIFGLVLQPRRERAVHRWASVAPAELNGRPIAPAPRAVDHRRADRTWATRRG